MSVPSPTQDGDSAPSITISMLGPLRLELGGQAMPKLRSRSGRWLLALLALRSGREVERMWLAGSLWPDSPDSVALATLRRTLTDLRTCLGAGARCISSPTRHTLRFDPSGCSIDVLEFDRLIRNGDCRSLEAAISLYRGPLLEGCSEEWALQEREARSQAFLDALERLAEDTACQSRFSEAADYLRRVISVDPLRECAQRSLIRALFSCGDHSAAVQVYRDLRLHLRRELNTAPDPETVALYEEMRRQTPARRPADAVSCAFEARSCVPHPVTRIVARDAEIAEIHERMQTSRLVTLTGPGGVGKTRLAMEAARILEDDFADGAIFVELAALTEAGQVAEAVAALLGIREEPGQPVISSISHAIRHVEMAIVLDNCEHLIEPCASLADTLLAQCAGLRILASSRQTLGVSGEVDWRVQPLSLPAEAIGGLEQNQALKDAAESGAVQLFSERALAARSDFTLSKTTAPRVAAICRRLDGLPLAIELAAARARYLSLEEIESGLADAFELLAGGNRTAQPRQQTLEAALDWSYRLLNDSERLMLCRFSVFAGPFGLDAVRAVCCDARVPQLAASRLLADLVDRSLVYPVVLAGESRYRLLEITREYAMRRLQLSGEEAAIRRRHAEFFLGVTAEVEDAWRKDPSSALHRIDEVERDLVAVLEWCVSSDEGKSAIDRALRMASTLAVHCEKRGRTAESRRWADELLCQLPERTENRANALLRAANVALNQDDLVRARSASDEALSIFQESGNAGGIARSISSIGRVLGWGPEPALAWPFFERALDMHRELDDEAGQVSVLVNMGLTAYAVGDLPASRRYHETCLEMSSQQASETGVAWALDNLADVVLAQGEIDYAESLYHRALPRFVSIRHFFGIAECLRGLAQTAAARGGKDDLRTAALLFGAVETLTSRQRPVLPMFRASHRHAVDTVREQLGEDDFGGAWNRGRRMSVEEAVEAIAPVPSIR